MPRKKTVTKKVEEPQTDITKEVLSLMKKYADGNAIYRQELFELSKLVKKGVSYNNNLLLVEQQKDKSHVNRPSEYDWSFGIVENRFGVSIQTKSWPDLIDQEEQKGTLRDKDIYLLHFPTSKYVFQQLDSYHNLFYPEARQYIAWHVSSDGALWSTINDPVDTYRKTLAWGHKYKTDDQEFKVLLSQEAIEKHFLDNRIDSLYMYLSTVGDLGFDPSADAKREFVKQMYFGYKRPSGNHLRGVYDRPQMYFNMHLHEGDYSFKAGPGITVHGPSWVLNQFKLAGYKIVKEDGDERKDAFWTQKIVKIDEEEND